MIKHMLDYLIGLYDKTYAKVFSYISSKSFRIFKSHNLKLFLFNKRLSKYYATYLTLI